ncbi:MAG TPA: sulfur transferase domain-containing protein, partial [Thermohalobaculum sp.]|nr:sulfur transferase domain-containing protein [Thermohalobaculum sp.]
FARAGGRTVISLRAGEAVPALPAEIAACRELGLVFRRLPLRGHRLPSRAELRAARQLFAAAERPVLMHCQSGADRAGFAAALWLLFEGRPPAEARRQLSPRYGHNPLGRAGLLDAFLDACAASPLPFADWVETAYDPERITAAWRATGLAGRLRLWLARR